MENERRSLMDWIGKKAIFLSHSLSDAGVVQWQKKSSFLSTTTTTKLAAAVVSIFPHMAAQLRLAQFGFRKIELGAQRLIEHFLLCVIGRGESRRRTRTIYRNRNVRDCASGQDLDDVDVCKVLVHCDH